MDSVRARLEEQASIDTAELRDCFTRFDISELIANDTGVHGLLAERGWRKLAEALSATKRERILGVAATLAGSEIHRDSPEISVELAHLGLRVQGCVPPLSPSPELILRRPPPHLFQLEEFGSDYDPLLLREAILYRKNILIAGSTGTGKTRLLESCVVELHKLDPSLNIFVAEDAREIRSPFRLTTWRRIGHGTSLSARAVVAGAMRSNPDRVLLSEVRGAEALDLLRVWGSGHPGGLATIHANSARGALTQLDQLAQQAGVPSQAPLVGEVVDLVVYLERQDRRPAITELVWVHKWGPTSSDYVTETIDPGMHIGPDGIEV